MLSAARIIFGLVGLFLLLIGVLTAILTDRGIGPSIVFVSPRTDQALFGAAPEEVLSSNPDLVTFRFVVLRTLAGLLVATGLLTAGVAWFGMSDGGPWALTLLTVVGLAVIPFWWIALGPYREAGIRLGLGDIPPFMWVPALVMPAASLLGWFGYLRG